MKARPTSSNPAKPARSRSRRAPRTSTPNSLLGQLIAARKTLADQLEEQRQAAEAARTAAAEAAKAKAATPKTPAPTSPAKAANPAAPPADAKADEPASLWD